jgi:hypothetical protein
VGDDDAILLPERNKAIFCGGSLIAQSIGLILQLFTYALISLRISRQMIDDVNIRDRIRDSDGSLVHRWK